MDTVLGIYSYGKVIVDGLPHSYARVCCMSAIEDHSRSSNRVRCAANVLTCCQALLNPVRERTRCA
eukprot:62008-Pleurochrysis_carterae.AAC.1